MKKSFILSLIMSVFALASVSASNRCQGDWKQKMMSEKIAFFTVEMGISPEEAQVFWPVYNQVNKEKDEAMHKVFETYKELESSIEAGKPEKEISKLLGNYLKAIDRQREIDNEAHEKYTKVLPVEKLAKLYICEEKFRRQHIRKLHAKPEGKK